MDASIITIGDEILIGQIIDTNSAFLASELNSAGIRVHRIYSISDQEKSISDTLDEAIQLTDIIVITGGLGPTKDDVTKRTLANYFGSQLVEHHGTLELLKKFVSNRGIKLSDRNRAQALVPDNCEVLTNNYGTAPGILFRKEDKWIVSLPGVPYEMKALFTEAFLPRLKNGIELPVRLNKTVCIAGFAESTLADKLKDWEEDLSKDVEVAYLPSPGLLHLRISLSGKNYDYLNESLNNLVQNVSAIIGREHVFGYDKETLESVVGNILSERKLTLATAESCTGGNISAMITAVPGASRYFKGAITAYGNDIKIKLLNVSLASLEKYGAVSKQVVEEMARGARSVMNSDYAIATSGIAGPDGGTPEKPVGTVWIAIASPQRTITVKFRFGEHRDRIIARASINALNLLRNEILDPTEN